MQYKVALGAKYLKMKIGGASPDEDVECVRAVRQAIGSNVHLMVDANCAYSPSEAIQIVKRIEDFDIFWLEEPVAAEDHAGLATVRAQVSVPIASGENEFTRHGFKELIACGGADILQPDATCAGGIKEFRHIASLATAHRLPSAPHGTDLLHVHLVAAFSNGLIVGSDMPEGRRTPGMFTTFIELDAEGMVAPSAEPGLGIELDQEFLREHPVE